MLRQMKKRIAILGSTGSIGTQALDVIRQHPDRFEVYALSANHNAELLAKQAREFHPEVVCIADESKYGCLQDALSDLPVKVWTGEDSISEMVTMPSIDIVLAAMVGYAGLRPTIAAIKAKKIIAFANKETLVVAGDLVCRLCRENHTALLPVDSEHSAIFQSLTGEGDNEIEKILLTCSGGPFRTWSKEAITAAKAEDALKHPNWDMGAKITIDSATMMNKGFEVIEAKWLFGVEPEQIQVLVHPQSIIHSAVQFADGSVKAQLGMPDMRLPIQYAFSYPERLSSNFPRIDFFNLPQGLTFETPDIKRFPNLQLAYDAIAKGGNMPCVLNAANEVAVQAYLQDKISFFGMSELIDKTMQKATFIDRPAYEDYVNTDSEARHYATELI